jgi:hypothetical protein
MLAQQLSPAQSPGMPKISKGFDDLAFLTEFIK